MPLATSSATEHRKGILIEIGLWAMATGRGWLVRAVKAALQREGLRHD
jgi:hypothetical protein